MIIRKLTILFLSVLATNISHARPQKIVASIKPMYNLTSQIMQGVDIQPILLVNTDTCPHDYTLKPNDILTLKSADLIIWYGEDLESFLAKPIENLTNNPKIIKLSQLPHIEKLASRGESHHHEHKHHDHNHEAHHTHHSSNDPHVWLSPDNAEKILISLTNALIDLDPSNKKIYTENLTVSKDKLKKQVTKIKQKLSRVANKPFIVFHDAYQYFEQYFGLQSTSSITLSPDLSPSAKHIAEVSDLIKEKQIKCIFTESGFQPKIVTTLASSLNLNIGTLEAIGKEQDMGPNGYYTLLDNIADELYRCLGN